EDSAVKDAGPEICIFTSYTTDKPERLEMSRIVENNQRLYASRHGYGYAAYEENLASDALPYWSKIAGIRNYLAGKVSSCPNPKWIVWLDDDALVTNPSIKIEAFIAGHMPSVLDPFSFSQSPNVLVTKDVHENTINTGVLIVRNSVESRRFFSDLWDMR